MTQAPETRLLTEARLGALNGVARLGPTGDVLDAAGSPVKNTTVASGSITDASAVGKSILTALDGPAVRALIGAGTGSSSLTLGTTSTTAKAGNYVPAWSEITSKPTTFAPVVGTGPADAKAGNYVPAWTEVTGKPTTFAPSAHGHVAADLTDATVTGKSLLTATDAAAARTVLGVSTPASLTIADMPAGYTTATSTTTRQTSRTDVTQIWKGTDPGAAALDGDILIWTGP